MNDFLGQIIMFGGNFAIRDYAICGGQLMSISSNSALFSLLGTTFGGDGRTTFGLPDLRGRSPIGVGHGPGLQNYVWGERGGIEFVTLNQLEMPIHTHQIIGSGSQSSNLELSTDEGIHAEPEAGDVPAVGNFPGGLGDTQTKNFGPATNVVAGQALPGFNPSSVQLSTSGGSQSHENRSPFLAIYFLICLTGVYPSRN